MMPADQMELTFKLPDAIASLSSEERESAVKERVIVKHLMAIAFLLGA